MFKPKTYNLEVTVTNAVAQAAKEDGRSASSLTNRILKEWVRNNTKPKRKGNGAI